MAGAGVVAAVPEAVVVGDFFAGGDGALGDYPDAPVVFDGFAVASAGVVDEHGSGESVDDLGAVAESKEIGDGVVLVEGVCELFGEALAGVLDDALAATDGCCGVAAGGVDGGGADDEGHGKGSGFRDQGAGVWGLDAEAEILTGESSMKGRGSRCGERIWGG